MGKQRKGIIKKSKACDIEFYVAAYRAITANFCSVLCLNYKQYERFKFKCISCGKDCEASPSRKHQKKRFCSLECREAKACSEKERRKKVKVINLSKRGSAYGSKLRKYISQFKEMKCEICGYNEYEFCLDMHHIDHNPTNNTPENIGILCCMCHKKLHKGVITL